MARKKQMEDEDPPSLVIVMTVSLFIILLAFFILLNAMAVFDEKRTRQALGSLLGSFGVLSGGFSVIDGKGGKNIVLPHPPTGVKRVDFSALLFGEQEVKKNIQITFDNKRSVITIPDNFLFAGTGIKIKKQAYSFLNKLSDIMTKNKYAVDIIGHMDNVPVDSTYKITNRELSSLRALNVMNYFVEEGLIDVGRLSFYGHGVYEPVVSNDTKESREMNKRIEIIVHYPWQEKKAKGVFTFKGFFFKVFE